MRGRGPRAVGVRHVEHLAWLIGFCIPSLACTPNTGGQGTGTEPVGDTSGTTSGEPVQTGSDATDGTAGTAGGAGTLDDPSTTGADETTTAVSSTDGETEGCGAQAWYPDGDRDGFGDPDGEVFACERPAGHVANGDDCLDDDETVNPDAAELCNDQDDDCDGVDDEGSELNSACDDCVFLLSDDGTRYFAVCNGNQTWEQARTACMDAYGPDAELAIIDNATDQEGLLQRIAGIDHWIGMTDIVREGLWLWHDGSAAFMDGAPVSFNGWRPDQPGDNGEHCGELDAGGWADANCGQNQRYICEHPS